VLLSASDDERIDPISMCVKCFFIPFNFHEKYCELDFSVSGSMPKALKWVVAMGQLLAKAYRLHLK
jgi:hypothetical protein